MKPGVYQFYTYSIQVASSIEDAELRSDWELGDLQVSDYTYLSFLERTKSDNIDFYYVIVRNQSGQVCSKLYLQNIRFGSKNVVPDKGLVICAAVSAFLTLRPFQILVCGNVFAVNFPSLAFDHSRISLPEILKIIRYLEDEIKCDAIVLKDLSKDYTNEIMIPAGYQDYQADLTMSLDISPSWKSLDDYQNELTKKYKKRMIQIRHSAKEIVRKELDIQELKKLSKEFSILIKICFIAANNSDV